MSIQPPSRVSIMSDHIDPIGNALAGFFVNFHDRRDSPPGQPTAQFGHIKTPPYRLEPGLRRRIQDVFPAEKHILFVVPEIDLKLSPAYFSNGYNTVGILTYHELFDRLRSNFSGNPNQSDHTTWLNCSEPERWYIDNRLPPKIVIIFHIDPNIPADCAISLAGIVEWSLTQSTLPGYIIRLVNLSAGEDCDLLKKLLDTSGRQYHFTDLDLAQYGELDPMGNCTVVNSKYMETQVSNILTRVRGEPDKSRLILCFDIAFYRALNAKQGPEDDQFVSMCKLSVGSGYRDISLLTDCREAQKTVQMMFSPDLAILPLTDIAFEEIHIVVGYSKTTQAWDLVCREYPLSMEERRRQVWWAYQGNEKSVFMHIKDNLSPHAYIDQGCASPRFVEAHQLGGFIATVTSLPWFPRNRDDIITIFATNHLAVEAITDRLVTQRVIKSKGSALAQNEAGLFIDALPLLDYDYRLALLVATKASPGVNCVKTLLAAMLTTTLEDIVMLDRIPRLPHCVFKECRGFHPSMVVQGSMWLFLGLLRNRGQQIQEHGKYMPLYDNLDGFVSVNESVGKRLGKKLCRFSDLFGRHGRDINHRPCLLMEFREVPTYDPFAYPMTPLAEFGSVTPHGQRMLHGHPLPLLQEIKEMTPDEQRELHSDLFRAYMYQATVCHEELVGHGSHSGSPTICTLSDGDRCVLSPPDMSPTNLVDIPGLLRNSGDKAIVGISHCLEREPDSNSLILRDWTLIPKDVVYQWEEAVGPVGSVLASLDSTMEDEALADGDL